MRDVLLVRYGEVFLKGANRPFFLKALTDNVNRQRTQEAVIIEPGINVDTDQPRVMKHIAQTVISTVHDRFLSSFIVRPSVGHHRRRTLTDGGLHGDFAVVPDIDPCLFRFQFGWKIFVFHGVGVPQLS